MMRQVVVDYDPLRVERISAAWQDEVKVMQITVTPEDIEAVCGRAGQDPITHALTRAMGSCWRLSKFDIAIELARPFRCCLLDKGVFRHWQQYTKTGAIEPFTFQAVVRAQCDHSPS